MVNLKLHQNSLIFLLMQFHNCNYLEADLMFFTHPDFAKVKDGFLYVLALIDSFTKISLQDNFFIPENTWHAHILTRSVQHKNNLFHHWIISKMVEEGRKLKIHKVNLKKDLKIRNEIIKLNQQIKYQNIFYKSLDEKIFYYSWDVPRKVEFQIMKHFKFLNLHLNSKIIKDYRTKYFDRNLVFNCKYHSNDFKSFLKNLIKFTFPKIFLENFNTLEILYKRLNWANKPKYILTSYPYYDELFKFYCAQKYISGSKIIITQHGYDNIFKYDNWFVNKIFNHQLTWGKNKKKGLHKFIFTKNYSDNQRCKT